MTCPLWVVVAICYTLVAVRVYAVLYDIEKRIGRNDFASVRVISAMWPVPVLAVGAAAVIFGKLGIFDPNYKSTEE